jgi:hypothetical protein
MSSNTRMLKAIVTWIIFFIMSTSDAFATDKNNNNDNNNNRKVPQLLPADPESNLRTIQLGETITFEQFGPIILNTDGSIRRIANWDNLSEHEKEVSWRRISKRNEERRQLLLKQQEEALKKQDQKAEDKTEEL